MPKSSERGIIAQYDFGSNVSIDELVTSVRHQSDANPLILIADDSRVVRISLKNILGQDYEIIEAEDGTAAWNILQTEPGIRMVFSDLSMPNLDGLGLLRNIRRCDDERVKNIPFVVVTGKEDNQEIRNQLLQEGANDLITKPFVNHEITERAKRHIKTQHNTNDASVELDEEFLTGISNKARFTQIVRKELSFAIRNKNELALLLLKLDQFEAIKKHYTDPAIEHILTTTAEIIRAHTHIEDKIAYFGEGTFAILLPASNAIGTRYLGKRILSDLLAKKFYLGESDDTVTASIGVSAPEIKPKTTFSEILHLAEQRLQAAINAGGQRVVDKGNATITPVSTLLSSDGEEESAEQRILRETEQEIRQQAIKEVEKMKLGRQLENEFDSNLSIAEEINESLLITEQENKLIKEQLVGLRLQVEETDQLKKQLHETNTTLQKSQLALKKLQAENHSMRLKVDKAESNSTNSDTSGLDNSIVEQHLLQENDQLQKEMNVAKQRLDEALTAFRKSEGVIANLKNQIKVQREEAKRAIVAEQTRRIEAEQRLSELEGKWANLKKAKAKNPFELQPVMSEQNQMNQAIGIKKSSTETSCSTPPRSTSGNPKAGRTKSLKGAGKRRKPPRSWLAKLITIIILFALGAGGYVYWQQMGPSSKTSQRIPLSDPDLLQQSQVVRILANSQTENSSP
jgi:diguanylate cyclase (GGDEF)-like protein